jgi:hypothetical protein
VQVSSDTDNEGLTSRSLPLSQVMKAEKTMRDAARNGTPSFGSSAMVVSGKKLSLTLNGAVVDASHPNTSCELRLTPAFTLNGKNK